jgi:glycine cleavage system H protein
MPEHEGQETESSDLLTFMMGEFKAEFPNDRLYAKNHMWAQAASVGHWRFGFSAYAVRLLQDIYFLEFTIESGAILKKSQEIGVIESKKAESDLYAPMAGTVTSMNANLLDDPSAINVDKYGEGWLFELQTDATEFLQPAAYLEHLNTAWDVAQRTIKGQVNA